MAKPPQTSDPQAAGNRAVLLAKGDLAVYASLLWPRFELPQHLKAVVERLEAVERGEISRLMIAMPPRHGKSLLTSQIFPAWYIGRNPTRSIIAASYGQELASDFGRRVRNFVTNPTHRRIFPACAIAPDNAAAHRFSTLNGGSYFAVGAGGPITGRGADLLVIDDPIKSDQQAFSAAERASLQSWYESTAYTRLEPGGAIILIQTRWHEADLAGWLLSEHAEDGWEVLSLPACAEEDEGWRPEGGALWPARFGLPALAKIRAAIGGASWTSLYQQRPAAATGDVFQRSWWRSYGPADLPSRFESVIISIDTAFKVGASNDYSVAVTVGVAAAGYFVLDVWRERAEFPALKHKVEMLAQRWNPTSILIEDRASGQSLIQELQHGSRLPVKPVRVDRDKLSRANAVTPMLEAGRVFLPRSASWLADFIDELSSFPAAPHDDQVDAFSQALNAVREPEGSRFWVQDLYDALAGVPLRDGDEACPVTFPVGYQPRRNPKPEDGPGSVQDYVHEHGLDRFDPAAVEGYRWAKEAFETTRRYSPIAAGSAELNALVRS